MYIYIYIYIFSLLYISPRPRVYILFFILVLYGCSSTTTKTESEVDRAQFILLPEFLAMSMAEDGYKQELKKARENKQLNQNDEHVRRVREIGFNIIDQVIFLRDGTEDWNWEINVQESEEVNAYCMPGGKIMMYSALIEKTNATDDEIAAVMGHEIAHAIREHGRERMSTALVQQVGLIGFAAYIANQAEDRRIADVAVQAAAIGTTLFFALPHSREHEREADKLGMELAARAGYNPIAAVSLWRKMDALSNAKIPEFFSTHPSNENRIQDLQAHAKKINPLYLENKRK